MEDYSHNAIDIDHNYTKRAKRTTTTNTDSGSRTEREWAATAALYVERYASVPRYPTQEWITKSAPWYAQSRASNPSSNDIIATMRGWLSHIHVVQDSLETTRYCLDGYTTTYVCVRDARIGVTEDYASRQQGRRYIGLRFVHTDNNILKTFVHTSTGITQHLAALYEAAISGNISRTLTKNLPSAQNRRLDVIPSAQMDNGDPVSQESIQGQDNQQSQKESNTIITRDTTEETAIDESLASTTNVSSSEPVSRFPTLTQRWMPYTNFEVVTSQARGAQVFQIQVPKDLFTSALCAPNIAPFEAYAYAELEFEFKIVMNANKFQAGKLLVAYRNDPYGASTASYCVSGMMSRPHGVLDLPARNEVKINIPWKYHASFVRVVNTVSTTTAVQAGICGVLECVVLSPLNVSADGLTTAYGQVFYRFKKADFAGMSYRVSFQMDTIDALIENTLPLKTIGAVAHGIEEMAKQMGSSDNQDKPNDPRAFVFVPKPRSMFSNMKGIGDATVLRSDPLALTSYDKISSISSEPKSPLALAKIWGLRQASAWKSADPIGTRIFDLKIDPTCRDSPYYSALTPLEYATSMFAFWNGTIELRFDFVSTSFHQGSVIISTEFNRPVTTTDVCSTGSTYTKTFHLGEQKSVHLTVPYIYDTMYRRTNGAFTRLLASDGDYPTNGTDQRAGLNMATDVHANVRVTVVNQLKPVQNVADNIEILMFWRAGKSFNMTGLKQTDFSDSLTNNSNNYPRNLPQDFISTTTGVTTFYTAPRIGAKHIANVQMDTGEKENVDTTDDFSSGQPSKGIQNVDDTIDFKDILRRPTLIHHNRTVNQAEVLSGSNVTLGWFTPVMPPSRSLTRLNAGATDDVWALGSIGVSPSTAVMNLFRGWRGSTKYTFQFTPSSACNLIYITYIPHSGVSFNGNRQYPTVVTDEERAFALPYMSGYATEIVVPSVNPTAVLVVPYETELNWTLAWEDNAGANYTWRDKGYLNAGHIIVQPIGGSTIMNTWWSAGDDFALSMFYGPSYVFNESVKWRITDTGAVDTKELVIPAEYTLFANRAGLTAPAANATTARTTRSTRGTTTTTEATVQEQQAGGSSSNTNPAPSEYKIVDGWKIPYGTVEQIWWKNLRDWNPTMSSTVAASLLQSFRNRKTRHHRTERNVDNEDHIPQAQMFSAVTSAARDALGTISPRVARNAIMGSIPVIGVPLVAATTAGEISDGVIKALEKTTGSVDNITERISELSGLVGTNIETITRVLEEAVKSVENTISGIVGGAHLLFNMLLDLFLAWYHQSWMAVGIAIVRAFAGSVAPTLVLQWGSRIGTAIFEFVRVTTTVTTQSETSALEVFVGLLAGFVGTVLGVIIDPIDTSYIRGFFRRLTRVTGIGYFVQVLNFVRTTFKALSELVMRALGRVSPEAAALRAFSGKHAEIEAFVRDAQDITCEANSALWNMPTYKTKIWKTVLTAHQLQRLAVQLPNNVVSPVLNKVCHDVIKMGNEKFRDLASCPVRYEPFVICIEGASNIGKSFMAEEVAAQLLEAVGFSAPMSAITYVRQPGNAFWAGYNDQPVIVYDDWLQMNDAATTVTQLSELFQLKTPNMFIPNMAHLEEKKIRANPLIVILLCNQAYPSINSAHHPHAVLRRRDVVIKASRNYLYKETNIRELPTQVLDQFSHLQFQEFGSPTRKDSLRRTVLDFDGLMDNLTASFTTYHLAEMRNVKTRLDRLFRLNRTIPPALIDISDPFKIYHTATMPSDFTVEQGWIPSAQLEQDVEEIYQILIRNHDEYVRRTSSAAEEAQIDWVGFLAGAAVTTATSLTCWMYLFKGLTYATDTLTSFVMGFNRSDLVARCSVCGDDKPIFVLCATEAQYYRENRVVRHATCADCLRRVADARCPVCRNEEMIPVYTEDQMGYIGKIIAYLGRTGTDLTTFFRTAASVCGFVATIQRVFDLIQFVLMATYYAMAMIDGEVPTAYDMGFIIMAGILPIIGPSSATISARFQADDMPVRVINGEQIPLPVPGEHAEVQEDPDAGRREEEPPDTPDNTSEDNEDDTFHDAQRGSARSTREARRRRVQQNLNDIRNLVYGILPDHVLVTHDLVLRGRRTMGPQAETCMHRLLNPEACEGLVRYNQEAWQITYTGRMISISDCLCGPDCCWNGEHGLVRQRNFYEAYLRYNVDMLQEHVTAFSSQTTPAMKAYHKASVPPIFQPEWMYAPIHIEQQLVSLTWWQHLGDLWEKYGTIIKICLGVIGACATLVTGYSMYSTFFGSRDTSSAMESVPAASGTLASLINIATQSSNYSERTEHARPQPIRRLVRPQASTLDDVIEEYIQKNSVTAEIRREGLQVVKLHGIGICGHYVLIPNHYRRALTEAREVWIGPTSSPHQRTSVIVGEEDFHAFSTNDCVIWKWPASTNSFKDITKFFFKEDDLGRMLPAKVVMYRLPVRDSPYITAVEIDLCSAVGSTPVRSVEGDFFNITDVLKYNYSKPGACGSLIRVPGTQRPLIAMHVAGHGEEFDGVGYGLILTQEILKDAIRGLETPVEPPELPPEVRAQADVVFPPDVALEYHGSLEKTHVPFVPSKTKLCRSVIYGEPELAVDVRPAILGKWEKAYTHPDTPLFAGVKKHGKLTRDFSTEQLEGARVYLTDMLRTMEPIVLKAEKLTPEEAIVGIPGMEFYDCMDLKTSAGYPLMLQPGVNKESFVEVERDEMMRPISCTIKKELTDIVEEAARVRKSGKRYFTLWVDTLKDEKRPTEKALAYGGTRIICNGPFEHAIAMRQNFLHFSAAFMKNRHKLHHAVGINPTSHEWNTLGLSLLKRNTKVVTLDYSNFGPGLNAGVCSMVLKIIEEWTEHHVSGVDKVELRMLMMEIENSYHTAMGTVYSQISGAPSGNQMTTVINSLVNIAYIYIAWNSLCKHQIWATYESAGENFKKHVCLYVYGDDVIMTVSPPYDQLFNGVHIPEFFERYGIVATDAKKTKDRVEAVPFMEAEFLKRKFVWHPGRRIWASQLRESTLKSTTQWVWQSPNAHASTRVNCEVAIMNAHGYGETRFADFKNKVNDALARKKIDPITIRWIEVDNMFFEAGFQGFKF